MRLISIDFETSIGKTVHGSTFRDPDNDIYTQIWARHPAKVFVEHREKGFNRQLVHDLSDIDLLIGHNISFDLCYVFHNESVQRYISHRKGKIWDTQLVEYILTGQQHTTSSLAELQLKYLGVKEKPSRITYLFKKGVGADEIIQAKERCPRLFKLYDYYCHTDGKTPLLIFKKQYLRARKQNMLPIVELYNDYLLAIINMTCTGANIDVNKAETLFRDFMMKHLEYLKEAQDILKSVWTDPRLPDFNINSPDHKSAVLFGGKIKVVVKKHVGQYKNGNERYRNEEEFIDVKGYQLSTQLTRPAKKEGMYSTDDKVLTEIRLSTKTPKQVLEYCRLQELSMKYKKAAKTYCQAFIDRNIDGKLYPHFNTTITPTGRLTSSEPNLQNIPSKGDLASSLMGLLVAPKGWVCVAVDFSQLEKWIQCLVSGDLTLQDALMKGVCMHCMTLAKLEGLDYEWVFQKAKVEQDKEWDRKRTMIKPVGFLMDYGGMEKRVAKETGLPLEDVEEIYRIDKELYPDKHKFFEATLPACVAKTTTFSLAENIAQSKLKGKDGVQLLGRAELLPIFDNEGNVHYNKQELRKVGYWQTNYGKKYHFTDTGRMDRNKNLRRSFSLPKFKNYPNQGGGSDVQGATTAELLPMLIKKCDKIKMFLEIHDSKLFYVREDVLIPVCKWLKETIEDVPSIFKRRFNIDIPFKFPLEIKIGKENFGNMTVLKLGE